MFGSKHLLSHFEETMIMSDTYEKTIARLTELEAVAAAATGDVWTWDGYAAPLITSEVLGVDALSLDRFGSVLDISHYPSSGWDDGGCEPEVEVKAEDKTFITTFDPATVKELLRLARLGANLSEALGEQGVTETLKYVESDQA